jgi:hypothetical protein
VGAVSGHWLEEGVEVEESAFGEERIPVVVVTSPSKLLCCVDAMAVCAEHLAFLKFIFQIVDGVCSRSNHPRNLLHFGGSAEMICIEAK